MSLHRLPPAAMIPLALAICAAAELPRAADRPAADELLQQRQADLDQSRRLREEGRPAEAAVAARKVLESERRLFPGDPALADTLLWLAEVSVEADQAGGAESACREAVEILQNAAGTQPWRIADARLLLSHVQRVAALGQAERKRLRDALDRVPDARRLLGESKPAEAIAILTESAAVQRQLIGPADHVYIGTLDLLAAACQADHRPAEAEGRLRAILEALATMVGKRHPRYLDVQNRLALVLHSMGDYDRAAALFEETARLAAQVHGAEHPERLTALNNLAAALLDQGRYAKAIPILRDLVELQAKRNGQDHADYATALNNLAAAHQAIGDLSGAVGLAAGCVEVREKVLGPDHPDTISALNNLAGLYFQQGRADRAEPLFQQVLAVRQERLRPDDPDTAVSLGNLAAVKESTGRYDEAETLYRQALDVRRRALGASHPATADSLGNLAGVLRIRGQLDAAVGLYEEALRIRQAALGPNHPRVAEAWNNLAVACRSKADYQEARRCYRRALDIFCRLLDETFTVLSERRQLAMASRLRRTLDGYLSVTAGEPALAESAYGYVLAWKGAVFARQRRLRESLGREDLAPLVGQLQRNSAKLAALVLSTPDESERARWQSAVAELCLEKERLEGRLAERIGESDTPGKQADWRDVCESLPDGAVLIDFLEYEHRGAADAGTGIEPAAERRLAAFLLRKGGGIVRVEPGLAGPIGRAVEAWRRTCGAPGSGAEAGAELRAKVWMPLAAHLRAGDTVLISPDGCLGRLPFSALPGGRPGSYLLEEYALAVVPVPRILPDLLPVEAATHSRRATGLLLVGDVDYDSLAAPAGGPDPDTLALRRGEELRFTPLPSSRGEILSIRDSFEVAFAEGRTTILRRDQASEANFRREVTGHRFAHLATHGFFASEGAAVTSRPLGGLDSIENGPSGEASPAALYPGLLCGLALAGANSLARGGVDDGLLTAEEVAAMDLAGVDLAVLSACETGLGKAAGGEGLLGLQRAFQMAGARTVVGSLWKVNDESTRLLMEAFYANLWGKRLSKVESLRQAQIALLRAPERRGMALVGKQSDEQTATRLPFHWAAFVLSGDWR